MKKLFTAFLIIILAYLLAYLFVGKEKKYPLIPNKQKILNPQILNKFHLFNTPEKNKIKATTQLNNGIKQYYNNNYNLAIDNFNNAIKLNKKLYKALYWKAKAEYFNNQYSKSINDLKTLIKKTKNFDSAYLYLGKNYYYNKNYNQAQNNFNIFLNKNPQSPQAYDWLAWTKYKKYQSPQEGITYEKAALQIDSSYADAWFGLAYFYLDIADSASFPKNFKYYKKAINANNLCLKFDSTDQYAAYNNYYAYKNINNIDSAQKYAKLAIYIDSTYTSAYNALAYTYLQQKKYKKALTNAQKALSLDTSLYTPHLYAAQSLQKLKQFRKAANQYFKTYKISQQPKYILLAEKCAKQNNDTQSQIYYLSEYINVSSYDNPKRDSILKILDKLQNKQ
jgi:tetratricopeptide (TPR) repeat protein